MTSWMDTQKNVSKPYQMSSAIEAFKRALVVLVFIVHFVVGPLQHV